MASESSQASRCSPLRDGKKAQNEVCTSDCCCALTLPTPCSDDFRSAMHQANSAIKSLLLLSRQQSYGQSSSSAASPSTSPSTSTLPNPATATDAELSRARIENMAKLIALLQRNLRVRYELDVGEVVHASVRTRLYIPLQGLDILYSVLPSLGDKATKQARATAYRLIRHTLVDSHSVRRLGEQSLDWYIVKCVLDTPFFFLQCSSSAIGRYLATTSTQSRRNRSSSLFEPLWTSAQSVIRPALRSGPGQCRSLTRSCAHLSPWRNTPRIPLNQYVSRRSLKSVSPSSLPVER